VQSFSTKALVQVIAFGISKTAQKIILHAHISQNIPLKNILHF